MAPDAFARALAEDVADLLADLPGLEPVVAAAADRVADAEDIVWPGTPVLETVLATPTEVFAALAARGYDEAALVAADAPDLPGLLVAKPFSAAGDRRPWPRCRRTAAGWWCSPPGCRRRAGCRRHHPGHAGRGRPAAGGGAGPARPRGRPGLAPAAHAGRPRPGSIPAWRAGRRPGRCCRR